MYVEVDGARLFVDVLSPQYVESGPRMIRRPTVVLLHGGPGMDSAGLSRAVAALLVDFAHVIVYDHRGNGRSIDPDPAHWTLDRWADDVVGLCAALGVERPIVIGGSFGGFVAMRYAARHPDHPAGLGLLCTAARFHEELSIEAFRRLGGDEVAEIVRRDFAEGTPETSDLFIEHALPLMSRHPEAPARAIDAVARTIRQQDVELHFNNGEGKSMDLRGDLAAIRCPTLVAVGADDPITPPEAAREIVAGIRADLVRFEQIPGCGHTIAIDAPEALGGILRDFVGGIDA